MLKTSFQSKLVRALLLGTWIVTYLSLPAMHSKVLHAHETDRKPHNFYQPFDIININITLDPNDWDALRHQKRNFASLAKGCTQQPFKSPYSYFKADVTINGRVLKDIGIRKKGFLGSLATTKPSLKLKFHHHIDGQTLLGNKRLTLNNNRQDASLIRQCLAYYLFAKAGVPAPRCNFAHVAVNNIDLGIYANIEPIKKPMLRRTFGNDHGQLFEGQISDFRHDLIATFENKSSKNQKYINRLHHLSEVLSIEDDVLFLQTIKQFVDLDSFLTFWAMENLIAHWDGYSNHQNNFYVYTNPKTDGKFHFIPWGVDHVFKERDPFSAGQRPQSVSAYGRLAYRLYQIDTLRRDYVLKMRHLLKNVFLEKDLIAHMKRLKSLVGDHSDAQSSNKIKTFIAQRRAVLENELKNGPAPWNKPVKKDLCLTSHGKVVARFDTQWNSSLSPNTSFAQNAEIRIDLGDSHKSYFLDQVIAGPGLLAGGQQPHIRMIGLRDPQSDRPLIVSLYIENKLFQSQYKGDFHGFITVGVVAELTALGPKLKGFISDGEFSLLSAGKSHNQSVKGTFTGIYYTWPVY